MTAARNVLFVMCDQLRQDHLSCHDPRRLSTPNIDRLARRGVAFDHAYVQSGVCGPSRMSFYTGRYPSSHGATWNFVPMPVSEMTLGDYLAPHGLPVHLIGKTHVVPNTAEMKARGIPTDSPTGQWLAEGGFTVIARHEGNLSAPGSAYSRYLRSHGYDAQDPARAFAASAIDADGRLQSGYRMRHVHLPARVRAEHSETAFVTDLAIDHFRRHADQPWVMHLSYIKPHWPYLAPAPYHALFRDADTGPILPRGKAPEHPVETAYRTQDECRSFGDEAIARHVRPAYMGLIREIDDHLGRVLDELERLGLTDRTLIVFTSDHGDFLGDRGLGEKELFYEEAQRIPLIVVDPGAAADATSGTHDTRLVEAIDVVPTILDFLGMPAPEERLEGRSLLPAVRGGRYEARDHVVSELDYAARPARRALGLPPTANCHGLMIRTQDWKAVFWAGFRPQLFNLRDDPLELDDLGGRPGHDAVMHEFEMRRADWWASLKRRTAVDARAIDAITDLHDSAQIGLW